MAARVQRIHLRSVGSTNSYAQEGARTTFDPSAITLVTAQEQTAGRGRRGRSWLSTAVGDDITATFAFVVPPAALITAYQLSPLMSLITRRALAAHGIPSAIKWPNDVILGGCRKAGGILCEMDSARGHLWAALGLGLNVNSLPDDLGVARPAWPLTTLRAETGRELSVPALTDTLAAEFAAALPLFLTAGFAPFQSEYEGASVLLGKRVTFSDGAAVVDGLAESIAGDGRLMIRVERRDGKEVPDAPPVGYLSGEVSGVMLSPTHSVQGST
jgi:BirA family biotin operon repressor/biotin-[acetyl-CoA-carboxylase] ligase